MENLLDFRHIYLQDNRNKEVLNDLSFEVRVGEVHAIICTQEFILDKFLNMFCGRRPYPASGTVTYKGICLDAGKYFSGSKDMTYILRDNMLYSDFSVLDNIFFYEKFSFGYDREKKRAECQKVLDSIGLKFDLDRIVADLSVEEQKMLEFLRFFLGNDRIAVVYESVIRFSTDYLFKLNRLINIYKTKGKSIIFLTSSVDDAMRIADRISILEHQKITKTYTVEEIYNSPQQLFDLLTGWTHIDNIQEENYLETFDAIVQIRNISFSSYELGNVLQTLAANIKKIMRAPFCNIYLYNNADIFVISEEPSEEQVILRPEFIRNFIRSNSGIMHLCKKDEGFRHLFDRKMDCSVLVSIPIIIESHNFGMLMLGYHDVRDISRNDEILMMSLSKEVSLAIETSRLLGRSTLLQESHHRIKNNLQTIINLLYMQEAASSQTYGEISKYVDALVTRIKSIAIVHDLISKEKVGSYIVMGDIIEKILKIYDHQNINFSVSADNINLPYNIATSIALLINEIISNCTKHAFDESMYNREISVNCKKSGQHIYLQISDNGRGLPANFDYTKMESVGMTIIRATLCELKGTVHFDGTAGTTVSIMVPEEKFSVVNGI